LFLLVLLFTFSFGFFQKFKSELTQNLLANDNGLKRQTIPANCPVTSCSGNGGSCSPFGPCLICENNATACKNANPTGAAFCQCILQEIACFDANPGCSTILQETVLDCQLDFVGAIYGNCSALCAYPNTIPSPKICTVGAAIGCSASGVCQPYHTSGACTGPDDGTCGNPNIDALDIEIDIYGCLNSTNGFQCGKAAQLVLSAGDGCTTSADCADATPCVGGVCQGTAIGGACNLAASCVFGAYCINKMCTAFIPTGGSCFPGGCNSITDVCGFGGICVTQYSVVSGGNCSVTIECAAGFTCNLSTKKCTLPSPLTTCNVESDCVTANLGDCMCNADGTKSCSNSGPNSVSIPTQCVQYNSQIVTCANQFKCKGTTLPGSCFAKNCLNQANCFSGCVFSAFLGPGTGVPANCFQNNFPCNTGTAVTSASTPNQQSATASTPNQQSTTAKTATSSVFYYSAWLFILLWNLLH